MLVPAACRVWAAIRRSWQRNCCCWVGGVLLLLAVLLAFALGVALNKPRPSPAPTFAYPPQLFAATNSSLDFTIAVSQAGTVSYVVIPRTSSSRRSLQAAAGDPLDGLSALQVLAAARGSGASSLEVRGCCVAAWPQQQLQQQQQPTSTRSDRGLCSTACLTCLHFHASLLCTIRRRVRQLVAASLLLLVASTPPFQSSPSPARQSVCSSEPQQGQAAGVPPVSVARPCRQL